MTERKYETETMIKLYLHDEHVGYRHSLIVGLSLGDYLLDKEFQTVVDYEYDSFRQGIKLPDSKGWLFDGDKVKRTWMGYKCIETGRVGDERRSMTLTATGTLRLGEYGWWIKGESDNHFYVGHTRIWKWDELTLATDVLRYR